MPAAPIHLAQFNIARAVAPLESPVMADFVSALDAVNAEADRAPGFVWRLVGEAGASSSYVRAVDDPLVIVNLTVWTSVEALHAYTYRTAHAAVFRERRRWFEAPAGSPFVLWWIRAGELPTVAEGLERLEHLRLHGPGPRAFTFKRPFPPALA